MSQDDSTIVKQLPNEEFLPQVVALINEGHTITLPLRGRSMRPFLEDNRDKALLKAVDKPQVGDAVLAELWKGHFVLHRIISIEGNKVTLRGDGNLNSDPECTLADIRAKAIGFYRKGSNRLDSTNGRKWRIYSWWWTPLFPIRRYLLFALYPHVPYWLKVESGKRKENRL
jgi:hypothetical protein